MYRLKRLWQLTPAPLVGAGFFLSIFFLCWSAGAIDGIATSEPVDPPADKSRSIANDDLPAGNPESSQSTTSAPAPLRAPDPPSGKLAPTNNLVVPQPVGVLNSARLFALGMIETGNNDSAIGSLGEVSRFQIMPSVWKQYSTSRSYGNLSVSTEVACQHWLSLYEYFRAKSHREPTDFDMYVLWNTRFGHYASRGFSPDRLHPVIRDRAQRYVNLVEDGYRRESLLAMATTR